MRKNSSEKLLDWSEKIKNQKLSNKSVKEWCKEQGISQHTFQYWNQKINKNNSSKVIKNAFFEIPEEPCMIEIALRGMKISITKDFDRNALIHFLSLLSN
jgi:hypothetical protein